MNVGPSMGHAIKRLYARRSIDDLSARIRTSISLHRAAFLAFGRGLLIQRLAVQQAGKIGVGPQVRQAVADQDTISVRTAVQRLRPESDLRPKPLACARASAPALLG